MVIDNELQTFERQYIFLLIKTQLKTSNLEDAGVCFRKITKILSDDQLYHLIIS